MTKAEAMEKLELYKDRPIEVAINGAGDITVYGNIDGHWLFTDDSGIVSVMTNTPNGRFDIGGLSQREMPFTIMHFSYDVITYIKSYIKHDTVDADIASLTPAGTSKSAADILKEITSSSIMKANSPRGVLDAGYNAPGGAYGKFMGSAISTDINGLPQYYKDLADNK